MGMPAEEKSRGGPPMAHDWNATFVDWYTAAKEPKKVDENSPIAAACVPADPRHVSSTAKCAVGMKRHTHAKAAPQIP